ncbi:MAG TPA: ABC transporter permease [Candidatus Limnocylindrales bacterium]
MSGWRTLLPNAWYIAAREYRGRIATRSFLLGTILLAAIAFAATESPLLIDYLQGTSQTSVAVYTSLNDLPADAHQVLDSQLNPRTDSSNAHQEFVISWFEGSGENESDVQHDLDEGQFAALLAIDRNAQTGDLTFTLRTDMPSDGRQTGMIQSAVNYLALDDRLARAGVSISAIQTPPSWSVVPLKPSATDEPAKVTSVSGQITSSILSTVLIVLMLMAIITYGTWVAMSVGEEKGSRVMELMLNAATPTQMLAGKVVGNGAAGLTQYGATILAALAGLWAQGPIRQIVFGNGVSSTPPAGLSPAVFAAFIVLFLLGFILYALLYAALGSLVSRQEDIQSATSPLMMLIMSGYFISIFGLSAINETWVVLLSYVPFFTPYLMLARVAMGHVEWWEFSLAIGIMLATIGVALFLAARIYSAGVLLYGQRVGLRQVLKAARVSR